MKQPPISSLLWRTQRAYQVFGANTDVGKTIFTTLLCKGAGKQGTAARAATFLKPVSTGPAEESDARYVHTSKAGGKTGGCHGLGAWFSAGVGIATLFQWDIPVSPHLAAQASDKPIPSDDTLLARCRQYAKECAQRGNAWLFLETAGGVHSPTPSGTTQADLYTPLRLPAILVGDSRLGGISQTIAAHESLHIRGYQVESVVLFENDYYGNRQYLSEYFADRHHRVLVSGTPPPPERHRDQQQDETAMQRYYDTTAGSDGIQHLLRHLDARHRERLANLDSMAERASRAIWYPFTQQAAMGPSDITVIDSAHGDHFHTLVPPPAPPAPPAPAAHESLLQPSFDGSASWWTQGLGHASPPLVLAAAHAAGRYGHVMFAGAIHQPALALAETLLAALRSPRARRVFFSDDGSTGVEVALKMALRATRLRRRRARPHETDDLGAYEVLGLKGGYHGDTIGAMDCAEPCAFNEKTEWYQPRGHWFEYPTVLCVDGRWRVTMAEERQAPPSAQHFDSLHDVFDLQVREARGEHLAYEESVRRTLEKLHQEGRKFGALILEPVVLGAGGMLLVDPLFQRALVNVVRQSEHLFRTHVTNVTTHSPKSDDAQATDWSGLPVVFDEVFTGLYRLGRFTPASFLGVHPDISVHAKLLTGGLVPLALTVASESIFDAFASTDKTDALLHGHSYTAHPIGCQVAVESLRELLDMDRKGAWDWAKNPPAAHAPPDRPTPTALPRSADGGVWSVWADDFVARLSRQRGVVSGAWALGSVLAIHLKDAAGAGYNSNAALSLRDALMRGDPEGPWNAHSRVLGNVLYLMASQKTARADVERLSALVEESVRAL